MKNIIISILCSFYNYGSPHKYSSDNTFIQENWWNQQKWWNSYKDTDNFTPLAAAATTQAPIHQIQAPTQYIQPQIERLTFPDNFTKNPTKRANITNKSFTNNRTTIR